MNQAEISISGPADGTVLDVLGAPIRVQSSGRSDQLFYADHPVPPGYAVPLHLHEDEDELFYILDGELTLLGEHGEAKAGPGCFVHLPRGVPHGFENRSGRPMRMLVVTTPGNALLGVFRGLDAAARAQQVSPARVAEVLQANRLALVA